MSKKVVVVLAVIARHSAKFPTRGLHAKRILSAWALRATKKRSNIWRRYNGCSFAKDLV